ncbi:hypothetical protein LT330_010784 [Penicillium expansum]|nr:hypothetical protein LT330_010784 [Penicillium expansum]
MSTTTPPKKNSGNLDDFTAGEIKLIIAGVLYISGKLDTDQLGKLSNMKRRSAAGFQPSSAGSRRYSTLRGLAGCTSRAKKRAGKVVEEQLEAEPEIKTEAKSESTGDPVKVEIVSGDSTNRPVKVESDSDVEIKPDPTN